MARIVREKRFYDGGSLSGDEAPDRDAEPQVKLKRFIAHKVSWLSRLFGMNRETETFLLERKIGYEARWDSDSELRILVPSDDDFGREPAARFRSDLTSVPNM
ncbi:hypothetical protein [Kribbella lupini]|uniref:Uncharacterized protein n=1 Tax=Kribbella lupini TaxID=291602 RepID=A0ABP4LDG8_9ACTN